MRADELLILNYAGFSNHVRDLFLRLKDSPSFRELFLRDPSGMLAQLVFPGYWQPAVAHINQANRLLFSLLSNDRFMTWARDFQQNIEDRATAAFAAIDDLGERLTTLLVTMDRAVLYDEVMAAVPRFIDHELIYSMMGLDPNIVGQPAPDGGGPIPCPTIPTGPAGPIWPDVCPDPIPPGGGGIPIGGVRVEIETFVYAVAAVVVFVVVSMIDFTPKPIPRGISRDDLRSIANQLAERITQRATELRASGQLTGIDAIRKGPIL